MTADFEDEVNLGGWTLATFDQPTPITPTGGNPGGMLRQQLCCDFFAGALHTVGASPFTGDYRAKRVAALSVDLRVYVLDPVLFPLSLRLETDAGTPGDPSDDFAVFFGGGPKHALPPIDPSPVLGAWKTLTYAIPSQATELPAGWVYHPADPLFGTVPASADWNVLIRNVTRVSFELGPEVPYWPIYFWDLAFDNAAITRKVALKPSRRTPVLAPGPIVPLPPLLPPVLAGVAGRAQ